MKNEWFQPESGDEIEWTRLLQQQLAYVEGRQEAERKQLAALLNNSAVQSLSALKIQLHLAEGHGPSRDDSNLAGAVALVSRLVDELTEIARPLRPVELDALGLEAALLAASTAFSVQSGIHVRFVGADLPPIRETAALSFLRLAQVAFANMCEHDAVASHAWVMLRADSQVVSLCIGDNGRGCHSSGLISTPSRAPGNAMRGLMLRFRRLGGCVLLHSSAGNGTTITAVLPA